VLTGSDEPVPLDDGTEVRRIKARAIQVRPAAYDSPILSASAGRGGFTTEGAHEEHSDDRSDDAGGDGSTVHVPSTPSHRVRFHDPSRLGPASYPVHRDDLDDAGKGRARTL
jgi:hypothetical protein